ncbi:hypothetical protein HMPREF1051_3089 [Neisseria sicca VK64]|uniref:Uncharacterized protein n=1 Tax=Neisseria sicca VK64 TaxID=1095748 RepID=I2NSD6_NEISI|nr:hypothetical protein HMPREF1051_3089 [Neisseria sicca VK64]
MSFENGFKLRLKSVAVFSDDLGLGGSGLKVAPKKKGRLKTGFPSFRRPSVQTMLTRRLYNL